MSKKRNGLTSLGLHKVGGGTALSSEGFKEEKEGKATPSRETRIGTKSVRMEKRRSKRKIETRKRVFEWGGGGGGVCRGRRDDQYLRRQNATGRIGKSKTDKKKSKKNKSKGEQKANPDAKGEGHHIRAQPDEGREKR